MDISHWLILTDVIRDLKRCISVRMLLATLEKAACHSTYMSMSFSSAVTAFIYHHIFMFYNSAVTALICHYSQTGFVVFLYPISMTFCQCMIYPNPGLVGQHHVGFYDPKMMDQSLPRLHLCSGVPQLQALGDMAIDFGMGFE